MTTFLDYQNRKYDVSVSVENTSAEKSELLMQLFSENSGGEICTGAAFVAQVWLMTFLKAEGSAAYDDNGCSFVPALLQGHLRTEMDVYQEFALSASQVSRAITSAENSDDDPEDRFDTAELENVTIYPGGLALTVKITTQAGTSRKVILPLSIIP